MNAINDHIWWLASRASGLVALALITVSVGLGLTMAGRIMRKPGRARTLVAMHEQTALAGLLAIAIHGITLLGDAFLRPGLAGITIPGAIGYRPLWAGLGIAAGYLAAALGLSFYARKSIGPRLWRRAHRLTIAVYALAVAHTLGAGTDATTPWLRLWLGDRARDRGPVRRARDRAVARKRRRRPTVPARRRPPGPGAEGRQGVSAGVLIAGGGLAAQRCVETLRTRGFDAPMTIVCGEPSSPTTGRRSRRGCRAVGRARALRFRDRPGTRTTRSRCCSAAGARLAPAERRLDLAGAGRLDYDELLIATGAAPRQSPAPRGSRNAFPLRTLADSRRLAASSGRGRGWRWSAPASSARRSPRLRRPRRGGDHHRGARSRSSPARRRGRPLARRLHEDGVRLMLVGGSTAPTATAASRS